VIDNLAVSGEHAVLQMAGNEVYLEDLNSTNGTYVNGKAAKKQLLQNGDNIEIGKYRIKFESEVAGPSFEKTAIFKPGAHAMPPPAPVHQSSFAPSGGLDSSPAAGQHAAIKVLSGAAAGREVALTKVVTTIGKPGVAVAAITRRQHGFVVHHVEGAGNPTLNGVPIGIEPVSLKSGDLIELAGTQMQFVQT
jgi:hypothetical protein